MVGTNFNFRSQSCRLCWLVQISKEMYEFSPGGQLHCEIFVNSFLRKLLDTWFKKQVRHSFTVVFFSRTFYLHELDPTKVCVTPFCSTQLHSSSCSKYATNELLSVGLLRGSFLWILQAKFSRECRPIYFTSDGKAFEVSVSSIISILTSIS